MVVDCANNGIENKASRIGRRRRTFILLILVDKRQRKCDELEADLVFCTPHFPVLTRAAKISLAVMYHRSTTAVAIGAH